MTEQKNISVGGIEIGNTRPLVLMAGVNVLESRDLAMKVASQY